MDLASLRNRRYEIISLKSLSLIFISQPKAEYNRFFV